MRSLYLLSLVGLSTALLEPRQGDNSIERGTSDICKKTTTITVTKVLSTTGVTDSEPVLFPTSPSLRLPLPFWHNKTNATRNFSAPTDPSVPFSGTWSWKEGARAVLMCRTLLVIAVSTIFIAFTL